MGAKTATAPTTDANGFGVAIHAVSARGVLQVDRGSLGKSFRPRASSVSSKKRKRVILPLKKSRSLSPKPLMT
jgi:hypothetical protein